MKFIFKIIITLFLITSYANAQNGIKSKRYNNWYFGTNVGITFNNGAVTPLTDGQFSTGEGSSCISDKYGRLLFYTDGSAIWNQCHTVMPNGSGLLSGPSCSQAALVTPVINDSNKYYVFTVGDLSGSAPYYPNLSYSIVDMTLDNCRGDIMPGFKNVILSDTLDPWGNSEKLTAVKHANGIDYWVITRSQVGQTYTAFLVTATGVNTVPVVSANSIADGGNLGYMKASHNGEFIVSAFTWAPDPPFGLGAPIGGYSEICRFDNSTGVVDTAKQLSQAKYAFFFPGGTFYGVEFSPNDSFVYVASNPSVYRYNTYAVDPQSTEDTIGSSFFAALQMGPDGKIYSTGSAGNNVVAITNPDSKTNPIVYGDTIALSPGTKGSGLPNIFYYYTNEDTTLLPPVDDLPYAGLLDSVYIDTCLSQTIQLGIPPEFCRSYTWTPALGLDDDTLAEPTASASGIYYVDVNYKCNYRDSITLWSLDTIVAMANGDTTLCIGENSILSTVSAPNYAWSPSMWLNDSTIQNPTATPQDTTSYIVTAFYGICTDQDTVLVIANPLPIINLNSDTTICINDSIQLSGTSSFGTYQWQPNTSLNDDTILNPITFPITTTEYVLFVTDTNDCSSSDSIVINVLALPVVTVNNDTAICEGNNVQFLASLSAGQTGGGNTYVWSPNIYLSNSNIPNPTANPIINTRYSVLTTNICGSDSASINITVKNCEIYIPNAFTPNGDGDNDVFKVRGDGLSSFSMKVYDRWGNKVFESKDINEGWKGTYRGQILKDAVFVYVINITLLNNQLIEKKGNVTLIR